MTEEFIIALCGVAIWGMTYCCWKLGRLLNSKIKQAAVDTDLANSAIGKKNFEIVEAIVENVTKAVVCKLEQTTAKDLREKIKSGMSDRNELLALADKAYSEIISIVSESSLEVLGSGIKDIEAYVKNLIEKDVLELKKPLSAEPDKI